MADESKFHIGIKALIENDKNEILLLRTRNTKDRFWDLPGGRIQEGQNIEETLRREVTEELGIPGKKLEISEIFDAAISNFNKLYTDKVSLMLIVYRCSLPKDSRFRLSKEHSEWKWMSVKDAKEALSVKYPKVFLDKLG